MSQTAPLEPPAPRPALRLATAGRDVDIVVPVYNEEAALERSIRRLHRFLCESFPFGWRIVIADNASMDATPDVARRLRGQLRGVEYLRLERKGRALRAARRVVAQRRARRRLHGRRPLDRPARAAPARRPPALGPLRPRDRQPPRERRAGRARAEARGHLARLQPAAARDAARPFQRRAVRLQGRAPRRARRPARRRPRRRLVLRHRAARRRPAPRATLALAAGPAAYSVATVGRSLADNNVLAGPASAGAGFGGGRGGFGGPPSGSGGPGATSAGSALPAAPSPTGASSSPGGGPGGAVSSALIAWLEAHQGSAKYLVAAGGSMTTAPIIIQTGKAVVTIGGFNGGDPAPSVSRLQRMVATGERRVLLGGGGFGGPGGRDGASSAIQAWVQQHGTAVTGVSTGGATLYRVSA